MGAKTKEIGAKTKYYTLGPPYIRIYQRGGAYGS